LRPAAPRAGHSCVPCSDRRGLTLPRCPPRPRRRRTSMFQTTPARLQSSASVARPWTRCATSASDARVTGVSGTLIAPTRPRAQGAALRQPPTPAATYPLRAGSAHNDRAASAADRGDRRALQASWCALWPVLCVRCGRPVRTRLGPLPARRPSPSSGTSLPRSPSATRDEPTPVTMGASCALGRIGRFGTTPTGSRSWRPTWAATRGTWVETGAAIYLSLVDAVAAPLTATDMQPHPRDHRAGG